MNIPRVCEYIKANGVQCGSPALRGHPLCFFHNRWHEEGVVLKADRARQPRPFPDALALGNAKAIQLSRMKVMDQLLTGQIDHKTASILLYGLQTASMNLRNLTTNFKRQVVARALAVSTTGADEPSPSKQSLPPDSTNQEGQNPHPSGA